MLDGPSGNHGKWSQPGVPKKGWECIRIEDLGQPDLVCEMCETVRIRYVHYMRNSRYADILACGCICAGHMEEDLVAAERRDSELKSNARKRKFFPKRKGWGINKNGNDQIKVDSYTVTVFNRRGKWSAVVNHRLLKDGIFTSDRYENKNDAMMAAYDCLTLAKDKVMRHYGINSLHDFI